MNNSVYLENHIVEKVAILPKITLVTKEMKPIPFRPFQIQLGYHYLLVLKYDLEPFWGTCGDRSPIKSKLFNVNLAEEIPIPKMNSITYCPSSLEKNIRKISSHP